MAYFGERYRFEKLGKAARILAIPAAHHRFNYIHPFPDGNGRVSRLMSYAMGHVAGIGAVDGLWSVAGWRVVSLKARRAGRVQTDDGPGRYAAAGRSGRGGAIFP